MRFVEADRAGRFAEAYSYLSRANRLSKSEKEWSDEQRDNDAYMIFGRLRRFSSSKFLEESISGAGGVVRIETLSPDFSKGIYDQAEMAPALKDLPESFMVDPEVKKKVLTKMAETVAKNAAKYPIKKDIETYEVLKENDGWKVKLPTDPLPVKN